MGEERSFGCESITASYLKTSLHLPQPFWSPFPSCLPGYHQSWRWGEVNERQLLNSGFRKQSKDNLLLARLLGGKKILFNFLGVYFVFKRPHTVWSFETILWDSKDTFWRWWFMVLHHSPLWRNEVKPSVFGRRGNGHPTICPDTRFNTKKDPIVTAGCCKGWICKWVKKGIRQIHGYWAHWQLLNVRIWLQSLSCEVPYFTDCQQLLGLIEQRCLCMPCGCSLSLGSCHQENAACWYCPGSRAGGGSADVLCWATRGCAAECCWLHGGSPIHWMYKGVQWMLNTEQVGGIVLRHAWSGACMLGFLQDFWKEVHTP